MPRFRPAAAGTSPLSPDAIRRLAGEVFRPAHFFVGPALVLEWEHVEKEDVSWEIFRGRLLDPAHTRQRRSFEAWSAYQRTAEGRAPEPLLSLKLEPGAGQLHLVRGLDSYVWEGYDSGGNVILSRERRKWVRELAGTIDVQDFATAEELRDELIARLFYAVVGSSRLPLSSVEAPLPAFSFGELFYCYRLGAVGGEPLRSPGELAGLMGEPALNGLERVKLLEAFLRAVPAADVAASAGLFADRGAGLVPMLRTLFNEVSLSPYTDFADKVLTLVGELEPPAAVDFLGHLLRQIGRHLTAYDLVTFHHRGSNYPDALLLDAVLKAYLGRIERHPDLFAGPAGRPRRRALRQGWLLRRRHEGHPVPDLPTSPGENSRVLPPSHPRVPEEQILEPARRKRRLFAGDPLPNHLGPQAAEVLRQSIEDLQHPEEARELGTALFLDRPLGVGKAGAEPDGTLLLASVAFSRSVAEDRMRFLAAERGLADTAEMDRWREGLRVAGLPLDAVGSAPRPGTVSLADARRAAPDFVLLRTTPGSVAALLEQFDFAPLAQRFDIRYLTEGGPVVVASSAAGPGLVVYDESYRPRLELEVRTDQGYKSRAGREYPAGGLRVLRVWEQTADGARLRALAEDEVVLPPRQ